MLALGAALPLAGPLRAQGPLGVVQGRVVEQDRPIAGATVEIRLQDHVLWRVTTDATGAFRFPALPSGTYAVAVRSIGYRPLERTGLRVVAGQSQSLTLSLVPAPVELESVEVTASPVQINRENTEFSTQIQEQQIELLPVGYDAQDLVALTPGARPGNVWGGATFQANSYQLDGLPANHPGVGGGLVQPSINWIEEVEVKGLGAGAEYGNFQGGLINVITKSGSNRFQAAFRSTMETHHLNASNLVPTEVGAEVSSRYDVEAEVRGPVVRDRLFYYLAGQLIRSDRRVMDHLPFLDRAYSPTLEERGETKLFGKLSWQPTRSDLLEASLGRLDVGADHYGMTGYERGDATLRLSAPTRFYNLSWRRMWGSWLSMDAKLARFSLDETRDPYAGPEVPATQLYGLWGMEPPEASYFNAPIRYRHSPESTTGSLNWTLRLKTGALEHMVRAGGEHSLGSFVDQRLRNGGMTWRPSRRASLVVDDPSTWPYPPQQFVATTWGGEVDLNAEVENSAAWVQSSFALGSRLSLSPGLRWGRWVGRITPAGGGGAQFTAVQDQAIDPRLGLTVDLTGNNSLVIKGHWGRYHQSMVAQFFDRVEGGNVFTNEEMWFYRGPMPADPSARFSVEDRDRLAAEGLFTKQSEVRLNETGPVRDYRQPYVDQWVAGLEKTFGGSVRFEALYVNRSNHDMVALVDLNRATNYTVYERVRVLDSGGQQLGFEGGGVQLIELWVPNDRLVDHLKCHARGPCQGTTPGPPPGLTFDDTLRLSWNPDYVLTTAPDAKREFDQLQLSMELQRPAWGAAASVVWSRLEGNLDNVTGYDSPTGYGAGPYVRVNEGVNSFGRLPNSAEQEMKASVWGELPFRVRGGLFWTRAFGDRYTPRFTLSGQGLYRFRTAEGQELHYGYLGDLEGHQIFIGQRGQRSYDDRVQFDVHLEREFAIGRGGWTVSLDVFNLFNFGTATRVNPSVNHGRNYYHFLPGGGGGLFQRLDPNAYYKAVLERVPPRTIRIGTVVRF